MSDFGLNVKGETGSRRVELECEHQNGLVYVVRAEKNWVCSDDLLHVHSLAGFFRELGELEDPRVREVMQRWGSTTEVARSLSRRTSSGSVWK